MITKGKIILPTGTGKTIVEAELIRREIVDLMSKGIIPIIKVNSSRILLCFQLFEEIFSYLNSYGITARYVNFNSGNVDDEQYAKEIRATGGVYKNIISTTSPEEVKNAFTKAADDNIPLVVFSTYHSSLKFGSSELVPDLTIHDEAHNCVNLEFYKVAQMESKKDYFFTATEKVTDTDKDLGMNNPDIFGPLIYTKCAKSMVEAGEMVRPMVHVVRAKKGSKVNIRDISNDYDALVQSIESAFNEHEKTIKSFSSNPDEIGAKVLVVCSGQTELIEMFETDMFDEFRKNNPDIHVYALSSEFGVYCDGVMLQAPVTNMKKHNLIKQLKALKPSERAIIFHVDMIGEGIDVPGITGVMPFRNSELSKFVQNIGRASRLHVQDRINLYNNTIGVADMKQWIKPYSWVIIPSFLENSEGYSSRFRDIIDHLRDEYGYIPQQHTLIDNPNGLEDEEDIDAVNDINKNRPNKDSKLKEFEHELEGLSNTERILYDIEVSDALDEFKDDLPW